MSQTKEEIFEAAERAAAEAHANAPAVRDAALLRRLRVKPIELTEEKEVETPTGPGFIDAREHEKMVNEVLDARAKDAGIAIPSRK